jgi:hypothetical protein
MEERRGGGQDAHVVVAPVKKKKDIRAVLLFPFTVPIHILLTPNARSIKHSFKTVFLFVLNNGILCKR